MTHSMSSSDRSRITQEECQSSQYKLVCTNANNFEVYKERKKKILTVQLNSRPVRRIELCTKCCTEFPLKKHMITQKLLIYMVENIGGSKGLWGSLPGVCSLL